MTQQNNPSLTQRIQTIAQRAGFLPANIPHEDDEYRDLRWLEQYGVDAFLPVDDKVVLLTWTTGDEITLVLSARHYVVDGEVRFDFNDFGVEMLASALAAHIDESTPPEAEHQAAEGVRR